MKQSDIWWTAPTEAESGRTVIVTGRDRVEPWKDSGRYTARVDVSWRYQSRPDGMPEDDDARLMEQATDALKEAFRKENCAIMTGIYTGDGERDWVFYVRNLRAFGIVFNKALEELPTIPMLIEAADDPQWEEYADMRSMTYIPDAD